MFAKWIILLFSFATLAAEPLLVPFFPSIHRQGNDIFLYKMFQKKPLSQDAKLLILFEKLYTQNLRPRAPARSIPKVIHQIWLGSPVPKKYEKFMKTWSAARGFTYKLWTDREAKEMPLINRKLFDKLTNYGAKADVLRYEILYNEGGLYVDTDFECLSPEFFLWASEQYDFYAGIQPLRGSIGIILCNGLMSAKKGHPFIKLLIDSLRAVDNDLALGHIVATTGPGLVTKQFLEYNQRAGTDTLDMVFTPTYFYPLTKKEFEFKEKERKKLMKPETVAVHYWEGSWL